MKVIFYAQSRSLAGSDSCIMEGDEPLTSEELWRQLIETFPGLASIQKSSRLARKETYLGPDEMLQPDDEIAIIPPVSGG